MRFLHIASFQWALTKLHPRFTYLYKDFYHPGMHRVFQMLQTIALFNREYEAGLPIPSCLKVNTEYALNKT
jgi:hypothetical protein